MEEVVAGLEAEVEDLKRQGEAAGTELKSLKQELATHSHDKSAGDKVIAQLRNEVARAKKMLVDLRQQAEDDKSPDISALEEDRDRVSQFISCAQTSTLHIIPFSF